MYQRGAIIEENRQLYSAIIQALDGRIKSDYRAKDVTRTIAYALSDALTKSAETAGDRAEFYRLAALAEEMARKCSGHSDDES